MELAHRYHLVYTPILQTIGRSRHYIPSYHARDIIGESGDGDIGTAVFIWLASAIPRDGRDCQAEESKARGAQFRDALFAGEWRLATSLFATELEECPHSFDSLIPEGSMAFREVFPQDWYQSYKLKALAPGKNDDIGSGLSLTGGGKWDGMEVSWIFHFLPLVAQSKIGLDNCGSPPPSEGLDLSGLSDSDISAMSTAFGDYLSCSEDALRWLRETALPRWKKIEKQAEDAGKRPERFIETILLAHKNWGPREGFAAVRTAYRAVGEEIRTRAWEAGREEREAEEAAQTCRYWSDSEESLIRHIGDLRREIAAEEELTRQSGVVNLSARYGLSQDLIYAKGELQDARRARKEACAGVPPE